MTHEELWNGVTKIIHDEWAQPNAVVAQRVILYIAEALREVTPAMVEAWETAGPIPGYSSPEYQRANNDRTSIGRDPEFISRAHATGNWLAMLDACSLAPKEVDAP